MQTFLSMPLLSLKPFVALLAVVNPLACLPFFIHYTHGFDTAQRKKTIGVTSLTVLVVLACCALLGLRILQFFGISLASFQVGGGLLLMISALNMLNAQPAEAKTNVAEASYAASQSSVAVVPLAIPLLTGPASMSTMVIFAERTQNMLQMVQLLCYAAVVAAAAGTGAGEVKNVGFQLDVGARRIHGPDQRRKQLQRTLQQLNMLAIGQLQAALHGAH